MPTEHFFTVLFGDFPLFRKTTARTLFPYRMFPKDSFLLLLVHTSFSLHARGPKGKQDGKLRINNIEMSWQYYKDMSAIASTILKRRMNKNKKNKRPLSTPRAQGFNKGGTFFTTCSSRPPPFPGKTCVWPPFSQQKRHFYSKKRENSRKHFSTFS